MATYNLKTYQIEELFNWRINKELLKSNLPVLFNEIKRKNFKLDLQEFCDSFEDQSIAFNYIINESRIVVTKRDKTIVKLTNVDLLKLFERDCVESVLIKIENDFLIIIAQFTLHQSGGVAIHNMISQNWVTIYQDEFGPEQLYYLPSNDIFIGYSISHYYHSQFEDFFIIDSIGHLRFVNFQETKIEKFEMLIEEPLLNLSDTVIGISIDESTVRLKEPRCESYYKILHS